MSQITSLVENNVTFEVLIKAVFEVIRYKNTCKQTEIDCNQPTYVCVSR